MTSNASAHALLSEFILLAEIYIVLPVGSVADECIFSALTFIKNDYQTRLSGNHLSASMRLFTQRFYTVLDFPYRKAFMYWKPSTRNTSNEERNARARGRYGLGTSV